MGTINLGSNHRLITASALLAALLAWPTLAAAQDRAAEDLQEDSAGPAFTPFDASRPDDETTDWPAPDPLAEAPAEPPEDSVVRWLGPPTYAVGFLAGGMGALDPNPVVPGAFVMSFQFGAGLERALAVVSLDLASFTNPYAANAPAGENPNTGTVYLSAGGVLMPLTFRPFVGPFVEASAGVHHVAAHCMTWSDEPTEDEEGALDYTCEANDGSSGTGVAYELRAGFQAWIFQCGATYFHSTVSGSSLGGYLGLFIPFGS